MNNEKDITSSLQQKINNINDCLETITFELNKLDLYKNILNDFTTKYSKTVSDEFKSVVKKIENTIQVINSKAYILETNKLKKIMKSNSGRFIEITEPTKPAKPTKKINEINDEFKKKLYDYEINFIFDSNESMEAEIEYSNYNSPKNAYSPLNYLNTSRLPSPTNFINEFIDTINFDINLFEDKNNLCQIAYKIFCKNINFDLINVNTTSMKKFIHKVSTHYHNNYYHNFKHAVSVLQFVHLLIIKTKAQNFMSQYELFAILISALVHDIDHPGHTNHYEINTRSHLALRYNDKSVLENHHCCLAFYLIHSKDINLLENLDHVNFSIIRNIIVECVLATDMKHHAELISKMEDKFFEKFNWVDYQDKLLFSKILVHTADLSNQVRPFEISVKGSNSLRNEFLCQLKKEEIMNLPSLDYMKLYDDKSFYSSEIFFSSNIVKPLWNVLSELFTDLKDYATNIDDNIQRWKELANSH